MSSDFIKIPTLNTESAALDRLKIDVPTFSRLILIRFFLNLQVTNILSLSWTISNFGQIGPQTTEIAAFERL